MEVNPLGRVKDSRLIQLAKVASGSALSCEFFSKVTFFSPIQRLNTCELIVVTLLGMVISVKL